MTKEHCLTFTTFPFPHWRPPLVLPALNLSILDADILIIAATSKIDDVLIEHGGVPFFLPLTFHLKVWRGSFQTFLTLVYGSRGFWD